MTIYIVAGSNCNSEPIMAVSIDRCIKDSVRLQVDSLIRLSRQIDRQTNRQTDRVFEHVLRSPLRLDSSVWGNHPAVVG